MSNYDYGELIDRLVQQGEISLRRAREFESKLSGLERLARQGDIPSFYQLQDEMTNLQNHVYGGTMPLPTWDELRRLVGNGLISIERGNEFARLIEESEARKFSVAPPLHVPRGTIKSFDQYEREYFGGFDTSTKDDDIIKQVHWTAGEASYSAYTSGELPRAIDPQILEQIKSNMNFRPTFADFDAYGLRREESMTTIAQIKSHYNYDKDNKFIFPIDEPIPHGYNTTGTDIMRNKPFKDLVFKAWGKNVRGVDPTKSGGYAILSNDWLQGRSQASISNSRNLVPFGLDNYQVADFPLVASTWAEFQCETDKEAVVISISHGHKTVALLLVNRKAADELDAPGSEVMYAAQNKFQVTLLDVKVPFPFNQEGDYNSTFKHYNTADVTIDIDIADSFGLMLIGNADFKNKASRIQFFPDTDRHIISAATRLQVQGKNVFNGIADVLWYAQENKFLNLQGELVKTVKVHGGQRQGFLVTAITGSEVKDKEVRKFNPPEPKAPYGLDALPLCPEGYFYIGDAGGFIYLTDKKGEKLFLPYEVFDLNNLIAAVEKLEDELVKKKQSPNSAVYQMREQIKLIQALFRHQADLLQGKAFSYESYAAQDFTKPSPFTDDDDDD